MATSPLLLHVFSTFATGGPQVRFAAIANRHGRRWRHAIVAMDGNLSARERLDPGLDVSFPTVATRKGDLLGNLRLCRAALRALRPQTLVTSNFGTIEWALANAPLPVGSLVPQVHCEDGFGPEEQARQLPRRVLMRRVALRRATVVVPSRTLQRIAAERWRLDASRLRLVPNGVDLGRFAPEPAAAVRAGPVIGTVAALRPEKNLGRLLRAFALLPPELGASLVIVGDGPDRRDLAAQTISSGLGGRVSFAGHLSDTPAAYRGFDIFALSSDTEQMPLSVLEAMAAGLPVAATDVGDVASMLAAANRAFVVPPDDTMLARALAALLDDPALRARLGAANRAKAVSEFDQERMFDAYATLFDDGGPGRPSTRRNTSNWPALVSSQPNRSA